MRTSRRAHRSERAQITKYRAETNIPPCARDRHVVLYGPAPQRTLTVVKSWRPMHSLPDLGRRRWVGGASVGVNVRYWHPLPRLRQRGWRAAMNGSTCGGMNDGAGVLDGLVPGHAGAFCPCILEAARL